MELKMDSVKSIIGVSQNKLLAKQWIKDTREEIGQKNY